MKNSVSSSFIIFSFGLGNAINKCVNLGNKIDFTTVILPFVLSNLLDHDFIRFLISCNLGEKLSSSISLKSIEKFIPKNLNGL